MKRDHREVSPEDEFKRAKTLAFRFLKIRNRSEKEIQIQLSKKRISSETIDRTIQYLKNLELINDRQFARDWIQMRLQKPLGLRRIFFELKQKGISNEIWEEESKAVPRKESEEKIVEALARRRLERYKNLDEPKRKRRIFEYLVRRGFEVEVITKVVENLCHCEERFSATKQSLSNKIASPRRNINDGSQ